VNEAHLKLCASPEWGEYLKDKLLPWVLDGVDLGDELLEVGPGPGLATDVLHKRVAHMTAVELDQGLADALSARMAGTNVDVIQADATDLPFDDGRFTAAVSFTMLHHIPTIDLQDRLLAQLRRVVRPGGWLAGADSVDRQAFRDLHVDDICNPVDPATFPDRLRAAGFIDIAVSTDWMGVRFLARVPDF
jgi:SAM-dependent methyltransferase